MLTPLHIGILVYLGIINLATLVAFGADKISSESGAWRIRERTLFLFSLLGGSIGALIAIKFFRHKSQKTSFQLVIGAIILLQLLALFASGIIHLPATTRIDYNSGNL